MSTHVPAPGQASPREPTVFISHKHGDRRIADAVREFIQRRSHREVRVYQSSSGQSESPELGRALTTELKDALWQTGVVILIYTTEDNDWQWCMWECGVATNPQSPDTRIIVFQCSAEPPRVFQDQVRVNVRESEDLLKFTRTFHTDPRFFPGFGRALAPKLSPTGDEVREAADDLRKTLAAVLPKTEVAEWSAQPLMRLQMSLEMVEKVAAEGATARGAATGIADNTTVTSLDQQAKQIFGIAELAPGTTLSGLSTRWAEAWPGESMDWIKDIESQLRRASRGEIPVIRWGYVREVGGSGRYAPLLSRVRRIPALHCLQFDVNLLPYDELAATPVAARMIPRSDIVCHRVDQAPLSQLKVRDLATRLKRERLTRMPFLDGANQIKMIVHRSMIDHYLAGKLTEDNPSVDIADVTMEAMLAEDALLKELFETSFGIVAHTARLSDVNVAMAANHDIQDVFVTQTGDRNEPILGWVTNAMIAQKA